MKNTYENGAQTREAVLRAGRKLFLEKGFHETGYDDICAAAYLNRSTVRYHFGSKENLRYEVFRDILKECHEAAASYCADSQLQWIAAFYLLGSRILCDPQLLRFCLDITEDYPTYEESSPFSRLHQEFYRNAFEQHWTSENISHLDFAMAYGHMTALMRLISEHPGEFKSKDLLAHSMRISLSCWEVPENLIAQFREKIVPVIDAIPV